jgi:hypothetical protein
MTSDITVYYRKIIILDRDRKKKFTMEVSEHGCLLRPPLSSSKRENKITIAVVPPTCPNNSSPFASPIHPETTARHRSE